MTTDADRIEELATRLMDTSESVGGWPIMETAAEALRSLSIELTEWKIRCAELEQNAEYIKSSDEAEDLKRALTDCSVELTELRQAKESLDWLIEHKGTHLWNRYMLDNYPPYLKYRLKEKE